MSHLNYHSTDSNSEEMHKVLFFLNLSQSMLNEDFFMNLFFFFSLLLGSKYFSKKDSLVFLESSRGLNAHDTSDFFFFIAVRVSSKHSSRDSFADMSSIVAQN